MLGYVIRATVNSGENKYLHRTTFDWTHSISSARIIEDKEKAEMLFNKLLSEEIDLIDSLLNVLDEHPFIEVDLVSLNFGGVAQQWVHT